MAINKRNNNQLFILANVAHCWHICLTYCFNVYGSLTKVKQIKKFCKKPKLFTHFVESSYFTNCQKLNGCKGCGKVTVMLLEDIFKNFLVSKLFVWFVHIRHDKIEFIVLFILCKFMRSCHFVLTKWAIRRFLLKVRARMTH